MALSDPGRVLAHRRRTVHLDPRIDLSADELADCAAQAAAAGARVLVVRDDPCDVIAVHRALEARFVDVLAVDGLGVPVHARFHDADRARLARALHARLSDTGPRGGVLCVDASIPLTGDVDVVITDLAPADRLLARLDLLHRDVRHRPGGAIPRAIVIAPGGADADPRALAATWERVRFDGVWTLPDDAGALCARCVDPNFLAARFPDDTVPARLPQPTVTIHLDPPGWSPLGATVDRVEVPSAWSIEVPEGAPPRPAIGMPTGFAVDLGRAWVAYTRHGLAPIDPACVPRFRR